MPQTRWPAVIGLPFVVCVGVLWVSHGWRDWTLLPRVVIAGTFSSALLVNAFISLIAAPLVGLAIGRRVATAGEIARQLGAVTLTFAAISLALSVAAWGITPGTMRTAAAAHITLAAGAMALGSLGALCGRVFRHPLDGAAVGVSLALLLTIGTLLAGPSVTDLSHVLIDGTLLASPLVTTAAAADIDILRMDVFYQVSPLARVGTEYSEWYVATPVYLVVTAACLAGVAVMNGRAMNNGLAE